MKNKLKSLILYCFITTMTMFSSDVFAQGNDCGEMPQGLTEINNEQAHQLWNDYAQSQKVPCTKGAWTDQPVLTYLACLSRTGLYSGFAKNDKGCIFIIWAVEERQGENVNYRYYALQEDLNCNDPNRIGSGTCPNRCP